MPIFFLEINFKMMEDRLGIVSINGGSSIVQKLLKRWTGP